MPDGAILGPYSKENTNFADVVLSDFKPIMAARTFDHEVVLLDYEKSLSYDLGVWWRYWLDRDGSKIWVNTSNILCKYSISEDRDFPKKCWELEGASGCNLSPSGKHVVIHMKDLTAKIGMVEHLDNLEKFHDLTHFDEFKGKRIRSEHVPDEVAIFDKKESRVFLGGWGQNAVFETNSGYQLVTHHSKDYMSHLFDTTFDDQNLLMYNYNDNSIRIVDYHNSTPKAKLPLTGVQIVMEIDNSSSMVMDTPRFLSNSASVAAIDDSSMFHIWSGINYPSGRVTLTGHSDKVNVISFSDDATLVATASKDKEVRIWNTDEGALISLLKGHTQEVTAAFFNKDGTKILTSSADGTVRIWDIDSAKELYRVSFDKPGIRAHWSDDEKSFLSIVPPSTNSFSSGYYYEQKIEMEEYVAKFSYNHAASLIELEAADFRKQITKKFASNYTRFRSLVAGASIEGSSLIIPISGEGFEANNRFPLAISNDNKYLAVSATYGERLETVVQDNAGDKLAILRTVGRTTYQLGGNHVGGVYTLGDKNEMAIIYNLSEGAEHKLGKDYVKGVYRLGFSKNREYLYSISQYMAQIWETGTGLLVNNIQLPKDGSKRHDAVFTDDGRHLLTSVKDKMIGLWNIKTGKRVFQHLVSDGEISLIKVSRNSEYVAWQDESNRVIVSPLVYYNNKQFVDFFRDIGIPPLTREERERFHLTYEEE